MASRRQQRRTMCGTKARHASETAALVQVRASPLSRLRPYRCKFCGSWHVGHPPKSVKIGDAARRRRTSEWDKRLSDVTCTEPS